VPGSYARCAAHLPSSTNNWLTRFDGEGRRDIFVEHDMPRRIPLVTLSLVAANVLAYRLELASGGLSACEQFGLIPSHFTHSGSLTPLLTSTFLHDPASLVHIGGNMAFLVIFGAIVEGALGGLSLLAIYALAGVAGGLFHVAVDPGSVEPLVGASGAIFGVLAVAGALRPRLMGFVAAFGAINVWSAFFGGSGNVSFSCHIGGLVAGFAVVVLLRATSNEALETA
jgi:membrane associated rhomboid family serine protease